MATQPPKSSMWENFTCHFFPSKNKWQEETESCHACVELKGYINQSKCGILFESKGGMNTEFLTLNVNF